MNRTGHLVKSPSTTASCQNRGNIFLGSEFRSQKVNVFFPATEHITGTKIRARAWVQCPDLGVNDATYCSRNTQWKVSACKGRKDAVQCSVLLRLKTTRMPQVRKNYMWCKLVFQARICSNQTAESQDGCRLSILVLPRVEDLASKAWLERTTITRRNVKAKGRRC